MDRSKTSDYLYRSLLDVDDAAVRELVGYLRSNQMGELGQLYRTAEAVFRYMRSEVVDFLTTQKKSSPDIVAAALRLTTRHDPASPSHELLSEVAISNLRTFLNARREFGRHCAHDFFVALADRPAEQSETSDICMKSFGIGSLLRSSIVGIRTKRPAALKLSWYMTTMAKDPTLILSGYASRHLEHLHLTKFKLKPAMVGNCLVVPQETWAPHRSKLDKYLDTLRLETKFDPAMIAVITPDGPEDMDLEDRDKNAVNAICQLKTACCDRKIPGVVVVSSPMVKYQQKMPPVAWYSLFVNSAGVARMVGSNKIDTKLEFWRTA